MSWNEAFIISIPISILAHRPWRGRLIGRLTDTAKGGNELFQTRLGLGAQRDGRPWMDAERAVDCGAGGGGELNWVVGNWNEL